MRAPRAATVVVAITLCLVLVVANNALSPKSSTQNVGGFLGNPHLVAAGWVTTLAAEESAFCLGPYQNYTENPHSNDTMIETLLQPVTTGSCSSAGSARWGSVIQLDQGGSLFTMTLISVNNSTLTPGGFHGSSNYSVWNVPIVTGGSGLQHSEEYWLIHSWSNGTSYVTSCPGGCGGGGSSCTNTGSYSAGLLGQAYSMNNCLTNSIISILTGLAVGTGVIGALAGLICAVTGGFTAGSGCIPSALSFVVGAFATFGAWFLGWVNGLGGHIGDYIAATWASCILSWCWGGGLFAWANPVPSGF
jgi:hypothetical protein